jgi:phage tail tape-measure protein
LSVGATPALARDNWDRGYDRGGSYRDYGDYNDYRRGGYRNDGYRGYDRGGDYRRVSYRGRDEYRCRDNGAGGAIIGAIAGGLLGNQIAGRGDRTTGTVVGGALGAITGHLIDKSDGRRC